MIGNSILTKTLKDKGWVEIHEIPIPGGVDVADFLKKAKEAQESRPSAPNGTLIALSDNDTGVPKILALAAAGILTRENIKPILNINCRDYNRIALQSMFLGAAVLGIDTVIVRPGKHQIFSSLKDARNVYDVDPVQLVKIYKNMRDERIFSSGENLTSAPELALGITENPEVDDADLKPLIFEKKLKAGADFFVTDPITNYEKLISWYERIVKEVTLPESFKNISEIPIIIGLSEKNSPESFNELVKKIKECGKFAGIYKYGDATAGING